MATGVVTAGAGGDLTTSLNTIFSEFKLLSQERGIVKNCATQYTLEPHTGASKNVLNYGRVSAYSITEGVDIAQAQALADAVTSYTPSEVGVQVILSDRTVQRVADPALFRQVGKMMSNAYELKEDVDGCNQFSSFSATLGTAGTVATVGHMLAGAAILRIGGSTAAPEPAPQPWFAVLHPNTYAAVGARLIPMAAGPGATAMGAAGVMGAGVMGDGDMGAEFLKNKMIASVFGLKFFDDANCAMSTTNAVSGIFSKEGLIYVSELEPAPKNERDESLRAEELNVVGSYIFGVYRPAAYGIAATFDATTPTS